jgi:hypothetical protein
LKKPNVGGGEIIQQATPEAKARFSLLSTTIIQGTENDKGHDLIFGLQLLYKWNLSQKPNKVVFEDDKT